MSNDKSAMRSILGPVLVAMGGAALIAFFMKAEPEAAQPPSQASRAAPVDPAAEQAPAEPVAAEPAAAPTQPGPEGVALGQTPGAADDGGSDAQITPEILAHAKLMIPAVLIQAIEQGNLVHIRVLREQLGAKRSDGYMSDTDFEALDLIIECLEHQSDARDEARDFLQFGASTILTEPLKRACAE